MRLTFAAIVMMGWPAIAAAQSSTLAPLPPLPPIGLPLPEITSPLTPIGLPLAPVGFPAPADTHMRRGGPQPRGPQRQSSRSDSRRGVHSPPALVYFLHGYDWGISSSARMARPGEIVADTSSREESSTGTLRLDLQPAGAPLQLYVDGSFVGTPDDLSGELTLPAGSHNLEIRAAGYAPLAVSVQITAGRAITYRGTLQRVEATAVAEPTPAPTSDPPPAVPPPPPSTFYYIPGCYMGNVPPTDVVLPANCDRTRLITRTP